MFIHVRNWQTHVCFGMSTLLNKVNFHVDGKIGFHKEYTHGNGIRAGGALIFGQEQDSPYGGFEASQGFR